MYPLWEERRDETECGLYSLPNHLLILTNKGFIIASGVFLPDRVKIDIIKRFQGILNGVICVGFIAIYLALRRKIQIQNSQASYVIGSPWKESKLYRDAIRCSEDMNPNTIEISLLGGDVTPKLLRIHNSASGYTDVITNRNRERIYQIFCGNVNHFQCHTKLMKYVIDQVRYSVESPTETGFAQHIVYQTCVIHEGSRFLYVTTEKQSRNNACCYHFCITHESSFVFPMANCLEDVLYYRIYSYGFIYHFFPPVKSTKQNSRTLEGIIYLYWAHVQYN